MSHDFAQCKNFITIKRREYAEMIRFVKESDAQDILNIYAPYITDNAVSFDMEVPTLEEFTELIRNISKEYPYLVFTCGDEVAGFAYAHRQMARAAYQWNAELSVYIATPHQRKGFGRALYRALIDILRLQNVRNVYGGVTVPNNGSFALHEGLGFEKVGIYHNTGFKCGTWQDVAWFEKGIAPYDTEPAPFKPLSEIDRSEIVEILERYR